MTTETTKNEESVTHQETNQISEVIDPSIEDMVDPRALVETQSQIDGVESDHSHLYQGAEITSYYNSQEQVGGVMEEAVSFNKQEATSIVRNILNKQYPFTQANAEKVLVALIENGLVTNVRS